MDWLYNTDHRQSTSMYVYVTLPLANQSLTIVSNSSRSSACDRNQNPSSSSTMRSICTWRSWRTREPCFSMASWTCTGIPRCAKVPRTRVCRIWDGWYGSEKHRDWSTVRTHISSWWPLYCSWCLSLKCTKSGFPFVGKSAFVQRRWARRILILVCLGAWV